MTGDALATAALGIKQTLAFKWYKAIRIDLHADKWPIEFENAVAWADVPVITTTEPAGGKVKDIVLILARERMTVREPHAIQMTLDEATEFLGELDAHVNPYANFNPATIALIMRQEGKAMAGLKMDINTARGFAILLWQIVDALTTQAEPSAIIQ